MVGVTTGSRCADSPVSWRRQEQAPRPKCPAGALGRRSGSDCAESSSESAGRRAKTDASTTIALFAERIRRSPGRRTIRAGFPAYGASIGQRMRGRPRGRARGHQLWTRTRLGSPVAGSRRTTTSVLPSCSRSGSKTALQAAHRPACRLQQVAAMESGRLHAPAAVGGDPPSSRPGSGRRGLALPLTCTKRDTRVSLGRGSRL
jgi:hypothetical protein